MEKYLSDYLDKLASYNQKVKCGDDKISYFEKMFSYFRVGDPDLQAIYEAEITNALKGDDFVKLQGVFLHSAKTKMLPHGASGYDHCDRLWNLLDLLACDDFSNIYRVLPYELPLSANGYPMYIHGTNLLLCLLYHSENAAAYPVDKVIDKAEKFAASKKSLWERSVITCLLGILQEDTSRISYGLQQTCAGFAKIDAAKYMKMQCQNAYGLIVLAKHFLSKEEFSKIIFPEYKNFSKNYMTWFLEQNNLSPNLCITYNSSIEEFNEIYKKQIAITRIHQPYLNSDNPYLSAKDKKAYYMDFKKMLAEFLQ